MGLRHVARTVQSTVLHSLALVACLATIGQTASEAAEGANVRIATYQTPSGDAYFAASVQPSADDSLLKASRQAPADVVVVVDTSASQAGEFRTESMAALRSVMGQLRADDRVRIFAADVSAIDLSESFVAAGQTDEAIAKLKKRLPLGNTNIVSVIGSVRAALVAEPQNHTRSIVYIGDGSSIDAMGNEQRFGALVSALRADRISVHSVVIGPVTNIELMAVLANQTGGVIGIVGANENNAAAIGTRVGDSAKVSPIWLSEAKLLSGMTTIQNDRLPPLRLDRDSILIGKIDTTTAEGTLQLAGETTTSSVKMVVDVALEPSHPDFAFLPGLVKQTQDNSGLMLPSAGSPLLREAARVLAARADELVRAGNMALQQGNRRGAKAVAEKALEADPNNTDAQALEKISGNRLIMQQAGSLDDIFGGGGAADADPFGGGGDAAPAADADPFGGGGDATPAGGADPFGGGGDAAPAADDDPFGGGGDAAPAGPAAAPPAAAVRSAPPAVHSGDNPIGNDDVGGLSSDLLDQVRDERMAAEGRIRAEVRAQLRESNRRLRNDPTGVAGSLKALLANVETAPDVNPQVRQELMSQVRAAIQVASRMEATYMEGQRNLEQQAQGATAAARLLEETFRREDTLKTLAQQLNALIDEGRYAEADGSVSLEFAKIAGDTITRDSVSGRHFTDETLMLQVYDRDRRYREMRERNFVDAFSLVLKANIPFVDEPPIVYPDADIWQRMSRRRIERYGAIELVGDNDTERRIQSTLGDETTQSFVELPLTDAIRQISEAHDIPIVVDERALEEIGLSAEEPVTMSLKNVSLRSFMRLMLRELDLTYMIKDEVMQITTIEAAEQNLVNKVYPVGDLVVPIIQLGGGGGMGGGGGGGMGGGGGGGMGGGGGGMGGGGMGGGGGGGMFAVPDEISLGSKRTTTAAESNQQTVTQETAPMTSKAAYNAPAIHLEVKEGQSRDDAWDQFFADPKIKTAEDLTILDQRIRRTVRILSVKASQAQDADKTEVVDYFAQARDAIAAAIRAGHVQPWMYQAYAVALKATAAPVEDIERALLSAVDFAETPEDVLHVAARLEEIGSDATALRLCRNVAEIDEYRREPYVMGLRIAQRLDSLEGLTWACQGVLSQAWPEKFQPVVDNARLVARATHAQLIEEGRTEDAQKFSAALKLAASHDAIVRVSWTGDADIDLAVEEPSGTVCSIDSLSTSGGGTLLGDAFPGSDSSQSGSVSETYLCPQGFSGQYRLLVRRVWGNVSTGHVSVEVLTDVGRPSQRFIRKDVPLTEKDALVVFEVKEGQRKQEVAEAQLAHLRDVQRDVQGQMLGQIAEPVDSGEILRDLFKDVQALSGGGLGRNGFARRGAVGFRPELTVLPEGANLSTLAIISADRRYVRITPVPFFSQIGDVTTFNFVTGEEGAGAGGGGGGGLGGGGFGGAGN